MTWPGGASPADTLISDSHTPRLGDSTPLSLGPPSLGLFVAAASADSERTESQAVLGARRYVIKAVFQKVLQQAWDWQVSMGHCWCRQCAQTVSCNRALPSSRWMNVLAGRLSACPLFCPRTKSTLGRGWSWHR